MSQFTSYRLRIVSVILLSLVIAGHQGTLAGRGSVAPDHEVLRDLIGEFYAQYAREDVAAFMSLWSAESPDAAARKQAAEKFFAEHDRIEVANVSFRKSAAALPRRSKIPEALQRAAMAAGVLRDGQQGLSRLPFSRREAEMILALARAGAGLKVLDFEANQTTATSS